METTWRTFFVAGGVYSRIQRAICCRASNRYLDFERYNRLKRTRDATPLVTARKRVTMAVVGPRASKRDWGPNKFDTFSSLGPMKSRVIEPELMDDPGLDPEEHRRALTGLARINYFTGVGRATYRRLRAWSAASPRPLRVLDIATGSGDLPIQWAKLAARERFELAVTGVDVSPVAIATAARRAEGAGIDADWIVADALEETLPNDFDVVTCSLFLHHLEDDDIVRILRVMRDCTDRGGEIRRLLVCDLARSRFNLALVSLAAQLVTRSRVVHRDAVLSVRAALTLPEFATLAEVALGTTIQPKQLPPCRFICEIPL